jgi:hypothetical protein
MPGFNTIPTSAGGGGLPNMTFIGAVHLSTYNRSWAQAGTAGIYAMYSANQETGYIYFVGNGVSTGLPMNRVGNITHAFTRIDIIGSTNDMACLYKAKVKTTTVYNNPFDADPSIGKTALGADAITAYFQFNRSSFGLRHTGNGTFSLPSTATPLINLLVVGGGAGGGHTHCGAGGGGGGIIRLTGFPGTGSPAITIGGGSSHQGQGGTTYFGNVYAIGGGFGGDHSYNAGNGANGGGAPGHRGTSTGGSGTVQTSGTGLGTVGTPAYYGGHNGGSSAGADTQQSAGGGGGGGGAAGGAGTTSTYGVGGIGHVSDISGNATYYSHGGDGGRANTNNPQSFGVTYSQYYGSGGRGAGHQGSGYTNGTNGVVEARYFIS